MYRGYIKAELDKRETARGRDLPINNLRVPSHVVYNSLSHTS